MVGDSREEARSERKKWREMRSERKKMREMIGNEVRKKKMGEKEGEQKILTANRTHHARPINNPPSCFRPWQSQKIVAGQGLIHVIDTQETPNSMLLSQELACEDSEHPKSKLKAVYFASSNAR